MQLRGLQGLGHRLLLFRSGGEWLLHRPAAVAAHAAASGRASDRRRGSSTAGGKRQPNGVRPGGRAGVPQQQRQRSSGGPRRDEWVGEDEDPALIDVGLEDDELLLQLARGAPFVPPPPAGPQQQPGQGQRQQGQGQRGSAQRGFASGRDAPAAGRKGGNGRGTQQSDRRQQGPAASQAAAPMSDRESSAAALQELARQVGATRARSSSSSSTTTSSGSSSGGSGSGASTRNGRPVDGGRVSGAGPGPGSAAAAAAAAAGAGLQGPRAAGPTSVPRKAGVTDGPWDGADQAAVADALRDAKTAADRKFKEHGEVLLGASDEVLAELAARAGQPAYRGKQLRDAVLKGARSVADISTLPKAWRQQLVQEGVRTGRSVIHHSVDAADGTRKFLLQLYDGLVVETVGIPVDDDNASRLTVCVSSQVGCPMRCTFCATGKGGFARNLAPHEIVDQVLTVQEAFGKRVSNVVFMGMGEPLLNLPGVVAAQQVLNKDVGIGARHITISTVGVPNAIMKLAKFQLQTTLAVSIHAPNQALRESLVPSARVYPIQALMQDCAAYFRATGRRVTFEYTLLAGVNDQAVHAKELAALLQRYDLRGHVNLIPWNPVAGGEFKRPARRAVQDFQRVLEGAGVPVSIRITRGLEAAAACGQLRNEFQKTPLQEFAALA